jgi:hypothetical protein
MWNNFQRKINNGISMLFHRARWGQTVIESSSYSSFTGIDSDAFGNIFAAGGITGNSRFTFQENISISGAYDGYNSALVKYIPE